MALDTNGNLYIVHIGVPYGHLVSENIVIPKYFPKSISRPFSRHGKFSKLAMSLWLPTLQKRKEMNFKNVLKHNSMKNQCYIRSVKVSVFTNSSSNIQLTQKEKSLNVKLQNVQFFSFCHDDKYYISKQFQSQCEKVSQNIKSRLFHISIQCQEATEQNIRI